jgi:hypothetical protein
MTMGSDGVGGTADYNNFRYASENSDANATITKIKGKHEISAGFEWMKRYLNVGQPPAPAGSYLFDISLLPISRWRVRPVAAISPPLLIGMGSTPGSNESAELSQLHQRRLRCRIKPVLRGVHRGYVSRHTGSDHYGRLALGHLWRTQRAL